MQSNNTAQQIGLSEIDNQFLAHLRSVSILMIVLLHVGLGWVFKPWSEFTHVFVAIFFFISGAVSLHSYQRSKSTCSYLGKRLFSLYIPYLMLCLLSLTVYVLVHKGQFPPLNLNKLRAWLEIRPYAKTMPFNVGQVWFIHTLVIISLISPIIFSLILHGRKFLLWLISFMLILLSSVQLFYDVDNFFIVAGNNLYKPLVHTIFFAFGAWYFSDKKICKANSMLCLLFGCLMVVLCVFLVQQFDLKIGYTHHTYAPDFYYVLGSFAAISIALSLKHVFVSFVASKKIFTSFLNIFFIYTMPIFLLHPFSIYICENIFGLVHPEHNFIIYGVVKFTLVIILTLLLSYPFLSISSFIINKLKLKNQGNLAIE